MEILAVNISYIIKNNNISNWDSLISLLDPSLQIKIGRFRKFEDQLRTLYGELLIRIYAADRWNLSSTEVVRKVNAYGKPSFVEHPMYHYNITHSGHWVVGAFDNYPIGIDVETIAPIESSIAYHFFAKSEVEMLSLQNEKNRQTLFYHLWTLKESYIKAEGLGISIPLNSFAFDISEHKEIQLYLSNKIISKWHFKQYNIDPDYALSVCGNHTYFPTQIEIISWNELIDRFQATLG